MEHTIYFTVEPRAPEPNQNTGGVLAALWRDDRGFIISAELVMIATILVLGLIAGLACVRDAVTGELFDVADAIDSLNQSYAYTGMHGCWAPGCGRHSYTAGSCFADYEENVQDECFFDGPCQARCEVTEEIVEPMVVEPQVIEEPTPCVEPCPTPCVDPCPQPCPCPCPTPAYETYPQTESGTIYYYESGPVLSPQPVLPENGVAPPQGSTGQPGIEWRPIIAPIQPAPIW